MVNKKGFSLPRGFPIPIRKAKIYMHYYTNSGLVYRIAGNFHVVQNFAVFTDRSSSAKIKTAKIAASAISIAPRLPVRTDAAKIKTAKIFSEALGPRGDSTKFCTLRKFQAIRYTYSRND